MTKETLGLDWDAFYEQELRNDETDTQEVKDFLKRLFLAGAHIGMGSMFAILTEGEATDEERGGKLDDLHNQWLEFKKEVTNDE